MFGAQARVGQGPKRRSVAPPGGGATYGTAAVCQVRLENQSWFRELVGAHGHAGIDGFVSSDLLTVDNHADTMVIVVRLRDRASYGANSVTAGQAARFVEFRGLMEADPVWYGGQWTAMA